MRIKYKNKAYKLRESRKNLYLALALAGVMLLTAHLDYLEHLQ